jgi:hypothetical protein
MIDDGADCRSRHSAISIDFPVEHAMPEPLLLSYAGPAPARRRSFLYRCWSACVWVVAAALLMVFVAVRAALLIAGFICVLAGLILLTLGGKRSAARKLLEWRERSIDHLRLWGDDILRPLRRWRAARREKKRRAVPCLPVAAVTAPAQ